MNKISSPGNTIAVPVEFRKIARNPDGQAYGIGFGKPGARNTGRTYRCITILAPFSSSSRCPVHTCCASAPFFHCPRYQCASRWVTRTKLYFGFFVFTHFFRRNVPPPRWHACFRRRPNAMSRNACSWSFAVCRTAARALYRTRSTTAAWWSIYTAPKFSTCTTRCTSEYPPPRCLETHPLGSPPPTIGRPVCRVRLGKIWKRIYMRPFRTVKSALMICCCSAAVVWVWKITSSKCSTKWHRYVALCCTRFADTDLLTQLNRFTKCFDFQHLAHTVNYERLNLESYLRERPKPCVSNVGNTFFKFQLLSVIH